MGFKIWKKIPKFCVTVLALWALLDKNVRTSEGSAEGKSLVEKRQVHDYDEHFGFGLMSDDQETSKKYLHYHRYETDYSKVKTSGEKHIDIKSVGGDNLKRDYVASSGTHKTDEIEYIGCFDSWINNTRTFQVRHDFNEDHTHVSCSEYCRNFGAQYQVSLLKGGECICQTVSSFNFQLLADSRCDLPCPVSNLVPNGEPAQPDKACGSNRNYSVYCRKVGTSSCQTLQQRFNKSTLDSSTEIPEKPSKHVDLTAEPFMLCGQCKESTYCASNLISPSYDYFPKNDPESCTLFCSVPVSYIKNGETIKREPTKFAALLWEKDPKYKKPICQCLEDTENYDPVDASECGTTCPGNATTFCGRSEGTPLHATIYCTDDCSTGSSPPDNAITTPMIPTEDPCNDGSTTPTDNSGCNQETTTQEDVETSTTTDKPSTSSLITETPLTPTTSTTTREPIPSDETHSPVSSTTSGTTTSSAMSPTTTSMPPMGTQCGLKCIGNDKNGRHWEVCAGAFASVECGHNVSGHVIWRCSYDGKFETEEPDYSDCHSQWVGDMEEEAHRINDTESAYKYLSKLEEVLSQPDQNNEASYFGHEIHNVTMILNEVVNKAGNVTSGSKEFEKIAEKAVDVSKHLITSQEQWYQLGRNTRSALSTNLINTIEEASLHLTSKVKPPGDSEFYEKPLSPLDSEYFVSAGVLPKVDGEVSKSLVFPSFSNSTESFIKLPSNWKSIVPGDNIEFIGMYMDSQFASLIFPGQFQRMGVEKNDNYKGPEENVKVINGKLMSFTLASSLGNGNGSKSTFLESPSDKKLSIRFEGTGVQITFEHDYEAWGDNALEIRRKLHYNESPKAALGTSQCVFWDTKKLTWSTDGCKLLSSDRFHTVCECNHLTSFAVLMDVHNYTGKDMGLEILTLILCSLSFLCLFVSVTIFSTIRGVQNPRTTITKNLSICLLIGNTMVLLVLDRNYLNMSDGFCVASGIISHYVFLSAFTWMAIEGVHLYKMVVHVFDTENNPLNMYRLISYGLPMIIVSITVTIGYIKGDRPYGGDVVCWLDGHYIWSFMVPVAIVVMENLIILFIALKTAYQLQHNTKMPVLQSRVRSFRTWIRGCFSITILLGLTWLIGFFTLVPSAPGLAAAYIFTILNASQGIFIFVFHCLLNDKVRLVTRKRFGTYLPSWLSSSGVNSSGSVGNDPSGFGKRAVSNMKSSNSEMSRNDGNSSMKSSISQGDQIWAKLHLSKKDFVSMDETGGGTVSVISPVAMPKRGNQFLRRRDSFGTVSSVESIRPPSLGSFSDSSCSSSSGNKTDNSLKVLISDSRRNNSHC